MSRRLLVITGLSGSGKSTAARVLEDQGFFVVDNLPLVMLPDFMQRAREGLNTNAGVAVVIDVRNRGFLSDHDKTFVQLKEAGYQLEILFFEAADAVLQRRYSETRRLHPLATVETLQSGIERERQQLHQLRNSATKIIDSSNLNSRQLRDLMLDFLGEKYDSSLIVNLESFGYRYGLPPAADLVFDVRFLPNPYWVEELRDHTGLEKPVADYVLENKIGRSFVEHLRPFVSFFLNSHLAAGRETLCLAVGCTGGRHRSVATTDFLRGFIEDAGFDLEVYHRDIEKVD